MEFADAVCLRQEQAPVKVLPHAELRVHQRQQDGEDDCSNPSMFFVHGSRDLRGVALGMASGEHTVREMRQGAGSTRGAQGAAIWLAGEAGDFRVAVSVPRAAGLAGVRVGLPFEGARAVGEDCGLAAAALAAFCWASFLRLKSRTMLAT